MIRCKEKLEMKKGRDLETGKFTDDGFAIGVAYILKLLDQYDQLDSLHWQESVQNYFDERLKQVQREMQTAPKEEARAKTVTIDKLRKMKSEFDLFNYCFSGARVFFLFPEEKEDEIVQDNTAPSDQNGGEQNGNNNNNSQGVPPPPPPVDNVPPPIDDNSGFSSLPPPPPPPPPGF